jgi:hypothetical protein
MIDQIKPGSAGMVLDGERVRNTRLQGILRYWNELRGALPMPALRQIDPLQIPKLLPIILIADVAANAITMRLLGTDTTNAYGRETRGNTVAELDLGAFQPFWLEAFALVSNSALPSHAFGSFRHGLELLDAETVLAPLSDDGKTISHIMGGLLIRPAPCMATAGRSTNTGILSAMPRLSRAAT